MSTNFENIRRRYKNQIDNLSISNTNKTNYKNRINKTFNTKTMQNIVNQAKNVKNVNNGRVNVNNRRVNVNSNVKNRVITLAEKAARGTVQLLKSGKTDDAIVSALVLLTGILAMSQRQQIDANRVLNVFPRGLPFLQPYMSSTYTAEKWAKRVVFWFAQFKTKQFSPIYTSYEELFSTFGGKSMAGEYATALFMYTYYATVITATAVGMPVMPENVKKFLKGTLIGLYQKMSHRYTLSIVTAGVIYLIQNVYFEKLKLKTMVSYKIYEALVGTFVEKRSLELLERGVTKALPYIAKLKVRQLAPAEYRPALEMAVDTVARVAELSPGGREYPLTPGGGGGVPSPSRRDPFQTPPPSPLSRRSRPR